MADDYRKIMSAHFVASFYSKNILKQTIIFKEDKLVKFIRCKSFSDYGRPSINAPKLTSGTGTDTDSHYDTADDEILEACVKTATASSRKTPRERKRARNRERKSCKVTLSIYMLGDIFHCHSLNTFSLRLCSHIILHTMSACKHI